jgi:hypothetical protein
MSSQTMTMILGRWAGKSLGFDSLESAATDLPVPAGIASTIPNIRVTMSRISGSKKHGCLSFPVFLTTFSARGSGRDFRAERSTDERMEFLEVVA